MILEQISSDVYQYILEPAQKFCHERLFPQFTQTANEINGTWNYLGRHVDKWTEENLPKPISTIAQDAFRALPMTLGILFLPAPLTFCLSAAFVATQILRPQLLPQELKHEYWTGNGIAFSIDAAQSLALFLTTGNALGLLSFTIDSLWAAIMFGSAQSYEKRNFEPQVQLQNR